MGNDVSPSRVPKVSVMTPTFNHAAFLRESLDSVLAQGYPNLEIVVADDASTDETPQIIREYQARHPELFRVILQEARKGVTPNCNASLAACTGEYIALFAGDDVMLPGKLWKQVSHMERHPECAICYHNLEVFDSGTGEVLRLFNNADNPPRRGGVEQSVQHGAFNGGCANMVRRAALPPHGYSDLLVASDWLLYIEILASGGEIHYLPEVLGRYRRHGSSVTSTEPPEQAYLTTRMQQQLTLAVVDVRHPRLARYSRRFRAHDLYVVGARAVLAGKGRYARRHLLDSLRLGWVSWKWFGWFIRSFM